MNIEEQLKDLKNEYQNTKTPNYLVYEGWSKLKLELTDRKNSFFPAYFQKALIFAVLLLAILGTAAKTSQAAKPGDKLYLVKIATENISSFVTGNQTTKIENRVEEIIELSKNNNENLDDAIKRYNDTLESSKNNTNDKNRQELKNTLKDQEDKLREIENTNEEDQKLIEDAAEKTRELQGEIKGERHNNQNSDDRINPSENEKNSDERDSKDSSDR